MRTRAWHWGVLLATVLLAGCQLQATIDDFNDCFPFREHCENDHDDNETPVNNGHVAGMDIAFSRADISSTYSRLNNRISARQDTLAVLRIDFQQRAQARGETLDATGAIVFSAPAIATPLIQVNPLAALDLPPTMAVYEDDGDVTVAFNNTDYLRRRHAVGARSEALSALDNLLVQLAQRATTGDVSIHGPTEDIVRGAGVVVRDSNADFDTTVSRLNTAIRVHSGLRLLSVFDHRAQANAIGSDVNPSRLFLFQAIEPELDLLRARQSIVVDLPQRILVYAGDNGDAHIAYSDPQWLAKRHAIDPDRAAVSELADDFDTLADAASKRP